jgi:hypothetical protein
MKTLILMLATAAVLFGNDCDISGSLFAKYANRVTTAKKLGVAPDKTNINLAIHYGVEAYADCEKIMTEDTKKATKKVIQDLIKMQKDMK